MFWDIFFEKKEMQYLKFVFVHLVSSFPTSLSMLNLNNRFVHDNVLNVQGFAIKS
jgi:hypothetical protein